jgi:hypothetical protein
MNGLPPNLPETIYLPHREVDPCEVVPADEPMPNWRRNPATLPKAPTKTNFAARANAYFEKCDDEGKQPRLTGLALAVGLDGVNSLYRLGRREPALRSMISRCVTAVAHDYEEQLSAGNVAGATFMLKHIREYDSYDPPGTRALQVFSDKQQLEIEHKIVGVQDPALEGAELSPKQAYLQIARDSEAIDADYTVADEAQVRSEVEALLDLPPTPTSPDDAAPDD